MPDIQKLIEKPPGWLSGEGKYPEMVLSTRVRIARNLKKFPFNIKIKEAEREEILLIVKEALDNIGIVENPNYIRLDQISKKDRDFLIERHLATFDMTKDPAGRGIYFSRDETTNVMINEEDHLRISVIMPGFNLKEAFQRAILLDEKLGEILEYAFMEPFGYLTSCPTNVGLAIRISVLMHLPGVIINKNLKSLADNLNLVRATIRGLYGEGSEIVGNIFQISSTLTLGISEQELLEKFNEVIDSVIELEKGAREEIYNKMKDLIEDKTYRSLAILQSARLLSFKEAANHFSALRLGLAYGFILDYSVKTLNELLFYSQPVHIQKLIGKDLAPDERDKYRASYVKAKLSSVKN